MEIKEKDGKYYMILSNGELEISEAQAMSFVKNRGAVIRNNLQNWIDNFYQRDWGVSKVPNTAEAFIRSGTFFDHVIRDLEQIAIASNYRRDVMDKMIAFCNKQIDQLNAGRGRNGDIALTDYHILCWQRVSTFIHAIDDR
jgi:hypothetical protein